MKAITIDLCNSELAGLQNMKTNLGGLATFWFGTPWKQLLVLWKEFLPELKKGSLSGVSIFVPSNIKVYCIQALQNVHCFLSKADFTTCHYLVSS